MFLLVIKLFFQMKSHANIAISSHSPARWWSQIWLKITIYPHLSIIFPPFSHFSTIFPPFFPTSPGSPGAVSGTPRPPTWPRSPRPWAAAGTAQPRAARCGSPNWRRLGDFLGVLVGISNGISGNFSGIQWDWVELSGAHMSSCVYCWGQVISSGKLSHNSHNHGKIHHFVMGKSTISTGPFSIAM